MKEKEVHGIFKQKEVLEVDCFCFKNNGNDILFQGKMKYCFLQMRQR